jgi:hypothetical protein
LSSYETLPGNATPEGTKKYAQHAVSLGRSPAHFRAFDGLHLSSIGMGTYLGQPTQEDDLAV